MIEKNLTKLDEQLEELINGIDMREGIGIIAAKLLNILMKKEREIMLRTAEEDRANGYYEREMASACGRLGLKVPRTRNSDFRPSILPDSWKRSSTEFDDFVQNLVLQSYSPNKIQSLLESMNMPYSPEQVAEIRDEIYEAASEFQSRELDEAAACIYIDAYHAEMKNDKTKKVGKIVVYTVIGVSLEGKKELYGWIVSPGHETKEDWIVVLNNLVSRGLKRVMLIISDDFGGLDQAIKGIYPSSKHQLCLVHLQRNARKNLSKTDAFEFNRELSIILKAKTFEEGVTAFEELCNSFGSKNKAFINYILKKKNLYFSFLNFPKSLRKHIYTTNVSENFNSKIEISRINSGGYFQSLKTLDIAIFLIQRKIANTKWSKPIPAFRENLYELNQIFNTMFYSKMENV